MGRRHAFSTDGDRREGALPHQASKDRRVPVGVPRWHRTYRLCSYGPFLVYSLYGYGLYGYGLYGYGPCWCTSIAPHLQVM